MKYRRLFRAGILYSFILIALVASLPLDGQCEGNNGVSAVQRHTINIRKIRQEIRIHLDKIRQSGEQEISILDELQQVENNYTAQQQKVATLQERLRTQEDLLAMRIRDQQQAELVKENMRKHLQKRLHAFYLIGKTGFLNVTFSKKSLPELMLFNDSFQRLLEYDQSVIDMYRDTIDQLNLARQAKELETTLLKNFIEQAEKEQQRLDTIRLEKKQLLNRIRTQKGLYEQAVREMQKAKAELTAGLTKLKQKEENQAQGFLLHKGTLAGPVIGQLIVRFGETLENGTSNGIIISTAVQASVFSVYKGKVIFAGYKRGYGNMIIIDHGRQYYSVTAHLDELIVHENEQVDTYQQIGTTGDLATLFSKGLYFEIRHGAELLDPMQWFQINYYSKKSPVLPEDTSR